MRPLQWWAESAPPGLNRVKVSENLGATEVAPVAPADTSLLQNLPPTNGQIRFHCNERTLIQTGNWYKSGIDCALIMYHFHISLNTLLSKYICMKSDRVQSSVDTVPCMWQPLNKMGIGNYRLSFLIQLFYRYEPHPYESIFCRKNLFLKEKTGFFNKK